MNYLVTYRSVAVQLGEDLAENRKPQISISSKFKCVCVCTYIPVCVFSNSLSVEWRNGENLYLHWAAASQGKCSKGTREYGKNEWDQAPRLKIESSGTSKWKGQTEEDHANVNEKEEPESTGVTKENVLRTLAFGKPSGIM